MLLTPLTVASVYPFSLTVNVIVIRLRREVETIVSMYSVLISAVILESVTMASVTVSSHTLDQIVLFISLISLAS